jgi:hypothetical protein
VRGEENSTEVAALESMQRPIDSLSGELDPGFTVLLPEGTHIGRTTVGHPTLFVYVPATEATQALFSLQDEAGDSHYFTTIELTGEAGIVSLTLPKDAPTLEVGQNYLSFFVPIAPGGTLRPDSHTVTAWIKRVAPNAADYGSLAPLDKATPMPPMAFGMMRSRLWLLPSKLSQKTQSLPKSGRICWCKWGLNTW